MRPLFPEIVLKLEGIIEQLNNKNSSQCPKMNSSSSENNSVYRYRFDISILLHI